MLQVLKEIGIKVKEGSGATVGMSSPKTQPHLINLGHPVDDEELLLYYLQEGVTTYVDHMWRRLRMEESKLGLELDGSSRPPSLLGLVKAQARWLWTKKLTSV